MKNLKRALSFALASVMVIGMMVVGAGAAFTDAADVVNEDAVNMMVALNVINGIETEKGTEFAPTATVTREQMAKMITVALNGGKDPVLGTKATPSYTDIKGTWAESYIEYCSNLGIIAGKPDGTFAPKATVTGTEAAKMILIALGYDAKNEKFVNDGDWAININRVASAKGLYENLAIDPTAGLSRDDAAQMIWNGLNAVMVKYDYVLNTVNGNLVSVAIAEDDNSKTILNQKYKTYTTTPEGELTFSWVAADKKWQYTVNGTSVKSAEDFTDLFGMNVKMIAKNDGTKLYGIYAEDATVVAEGYTEAALGDPTLQADGSYELTIGATDYVCADATLEVKYFKTGASGALAEVNAYKLVDNNGDGKADFVIYTPYDVEEITYINDKKVTISNNGTPAIKDINLYAGAAKNDIVVVLSGTYSVDGDVTVTKADVKTGKITATKTDKWEIDGVWYSKADEVATLYINDTIEYVAIGGKIYYADVETAENDSNEIALVVKAGQATSNWQSATAEKALLMFADGTTKEVTASESAAAKAGKLVTWYIDENDKYVLTLVDGTNNAGYDEYEANNVYAATSGKIAGVGAYALKDDTVVFLVNNDSHGTSNKAKVVTGAAAKQLLAADYDAKTSYVLGNATTNGFGYASIALLVADSTSVTLGDAVGTTKYGYLTADSYVTKVDGTNYRNLTIWTADGEIKVTEKGETGALTAGTKVSFKLVDATTVKSVAEYTYAVADAITAWDGTKIKFESAPSVTYEFDEDTVVIYFDAEEKEGMEGGAIAIANKDESENYIQNVYVYAVDSTENLVKVIYVDVNNKI